MLDSLSWHVMDATADDWESLNQILPHVHEYYGPVDPLEVAGVVVRLVREGFMEEMQRADIDSSAIVNDPIEFWFRMTPQGRKLWDDEGSKFRGVE